MRKTVIVSPTNACNLRCKYCFTDSGKGKIMNDLTLENTINKFQEEYDEINYLWHGGEPLMAGQEFYEKVVDLQKEHKKSKSNITNSIQTNGILLNEDIIDLFNENEFSVSTSLDGPKEINDLTRVYPNGSGSFDDVMNNIELLKEKGRDVGAICVLNRKNIPYINEIYDFFVENDIGFKINPLQMSGRAEHTDLGITPIEYGESIIKLLDRWFCEEKPYKFTNGIDYIEMVFFKKPTTCIFKKSCQDGFIHVDDKGDVSPCMRFNKNEFIYGNINESDVKTIENNPLRLSLLERKSCSNDCKHNAYCNGGCMHNAYIDGDIMGKDPFGVAYNMIFDNLEKRLEKNQINTEYHNTQTK